MTVLRTSTWPLPPRLFNRNELSILLPFKRFPSEDAHTEQPASASVNERGKMIFLFHSAELPNQIQFVE
jgi:hypothetical protein